MIVSLLVHSALRSVMSGHWPNMVADIVSLNSLDKTCASMSTHALNAEYSPKDGFLSGELSSAILAQIPDELDSIAISETRKYHYDYVIL